MIEISNMREAFEGWLRRIYRLEDTEIFKRNEVDDVYWSDTAQKHYQGFQAGATWRAAQPVQVDEDKLQEMLVVPLGRFLGSIGFRGVFSCDMKRLAGVVLEALRPYLRTPDLTMLDSPEMVEAIMRGIYSSRGEKFTYDQAKEWAAKDGYIVAKCAIDLLEIEAKAALAEIKKAMGGGDEGNR